MQVLLTEIPIECKYFGLQLRKKYVPYLPLQWSNFALLIITGNIVTIVRTLIFFSEKNLLERSYVRAT